METTDAKGIFSMMLIRTAGLPLQWPDAGSRMLESLELQCTESLEKVLEAYSSVKTVLEAEKDRQIEDIRLQKILTNLRRLLRKGMPEKEVLVADELRARRNDLFLLISRLNECIRNKTQIFNELEAWFVRKNVEEKRALLHLAGNETLRRSLLFGSHSLLRQLPEFAASDPEKWSKKDRRTASALLKYAWRATTKTMPFSRLATVSVQQTVQQPGAASDFPDVFETQKPVVTPNVGLLPFLYQVLLRDPAFYNALNIRLNPGLLSDTAVDEWLFYNGTQESFQRLDRTQLLDYIKFIFQEKTSACTLPDLVQTLTESTEADPESLQSFIFQLVDYGYLEWVWPDPGFSPGWCGSLYNFLGFLPSSVMLTEAAYLLQWLRTAARTLPFQSVEDAIEVQREALVQCRSFFEKYGAEFPDIPPEQIFYEDVADSVRSDLPAEAIETVVGELRSALKNAAPYPVSGLRADIFRFGTQALQPGESLPFLSFCKLFLKENRPKGKPEVLVNQLNTDKIGSLLQFYKTSSGAYRAVLNALYPGGGKMMARWLHLFPTDLRERLQDWWPAGVVAFPWQEWTNANFQPVFADTCLETPDGRVVAGKNKMRMNELKVQNDETEGLQLLDRHDNRVLFADLGLEELSGKPPVIQLLWHLGTPYISTAIFERQTKWTLLETGVEQRQRLESQSLVLIRAAWIVSPENWQSLPTAELEAFRVLRKKLLEWKVPRYFFAGIRHAPARFFDRDSPLLLLELIKMVRDVGEPVLLTEMLPEPNQWIVEKDGQRHAGEWVLEQQGLRR